MTEKDRIQTLLRGREFDSLSANQWQEVIASLIREEEMHKAAEKKRSVPAWAEELPSLSVSFLLLSGSRMEFGEIVEFSSRVGDELSAVARSRLGGGLTGLTEKAYQRGEAGYELLEELITFNAMFEGAIDARLAERIALDREVPADIRSGLAHDLVDRDFSNSVPPQFWDKLREEVPQEPQLASAVMRWLVSDRRAMEALELLRTFRPSEDKVESLDLDHSIREALQQVLSRRDPYPRLRDFLKELPKWAVKLIEENVLPLLSVEDRRTLSKL
jgi:hypothetical protein